MLYREIIAVCSQIHTKHINTLCGQNVEFYHFKPGGTYIGHCALKKLNINMWDFGLIQVQYEMNTRSISWGGGVKSGRCVRG